MVIVKDVRDSCKSLLTVFINPLNANSSIPTRDVQNKLIA